MLYLVYLIYCSIKIRLNLCSSHACDVINKIKVINTTADYGVLSQGFITHFRFYFLISAYICLLLPFPFDLNFRISSRLRLSFFDFEFHVFDFEFHVFDFFFYLFDFEFHLFDFDFYIFDFKFEIFDFRQCSSKIKTIPIKPMAFTET